MGKSYNLFLHWKQGDDLADHLEGKTVSEGLLSWAEFMKSNATHLEQLAALFKDKEIECFADTHCINFEGDEEVLKKAEEQELIQADEFEDEDAEEADCCCTSCEEGGCEKEGGCQCLCYPEDDEDTKYY